MTRYEAMNILEGYRDYILPEDIEAFNMAIKALEQVTFKDLKKPNNNLQGWIPCSERLPECEQEVLICTEKKLVGKDAYIDSIVTPAIYEDGTMLEVSSIWDWDEYIYDEWDDTEDCGIIPEGWFENRHFNPEGVFNNPIDRKVVAWMPLPKPYFKAETTTDREGRDDD